MKINPSVVLAMILLCIIVYGLFVFTGNLLSVNGNDTGFITASGRIEGTEYHAAAKVAGKVTGYDVEEGQQVKAGQLLAVIDSPQLNAMIGQANAGLNKAEANLKFRELELDRYRQLLKENVVQKQVYDAAENSYKTAKADVEAAQRELQKLDVDLRDTKITAPVSGKIVTKIVQDGEIVGVGTPLAIIINMNDLYLKIFLPTEIAGKINLGDEARIFPDALPNEHFDAFVNKIAGKAEFTPKNVETKSQRANLVFEVKIKVKNNKDSRLKPGMPSEALIRLDKNLKWPTR